MTNWPITTTNSLHDIFNGYDVKHIKLISSCELAKEQWDILQTTFEGLSDVKRNKLFSLNPIFESLRMLEDELLFDFSTKLCDIAKESFCEKIS